MGATPLYLAALLLTLAIGPGVGRPPYVLFLIKAAIPVRVVVSVRSIGAAHRTWMCPSADRAG